MDVFLEKTIQALNVNPDDKRLSGGFCFDCDDNKEDCILVMGINPAGDSIDALREKNNQSRTYFFSLKNSGKFEYCSNVYFNPIYEFANRITSDNSKWPWCSKSRSEILEEIHRYNDLLPYEKDILEQFDASCHRKITIYIADMFYYHETSQSNLPLRKKFPYSKYCIDMMKEHINFLKAHNKSIKFVYVNNAKVSKWMCGTQVLTSQEINGTKIFYGGMLSGQRAMDVFSRERLEREIKDYLTKTK